MRGAIPRGGGESKPRRWHLLKMGDQEDFWMIKLQRNLKKKSLHVGRRVRDDLEPKLYCRVEGE